MAGNFNAFLGYMPVEVGKNCLQCIACFLHRQQFGIRDYPKAELMVFQPSLEIWDQDVQQILFRLVEATEVGAPGHVTDDADSGVPEF